MYLQSDLKLPNIWGHEGPGGSHAGNERTGAGGGGTDIQGMRDLGGLNAGSEGPGAALQGVRDLGAEMQEVRELRGCHPESKRS